MTLSILEEIDQVARSHRIPYHVLLELTYGCNLRCVMCYNPTHTARGELALRDYIDLFDQLAVLGTVQLTLTGGEVLARHDFWDIARAARSRHFALRVFSNATRVTAKVAQRFADLALLSIEVSLYGATAATHDAVTACPGSFARTLAGIGHLRDAHVPVMVKTLLTQINKHEIQDVWDLVAGMGVDFKGVDPVVFANHRGDPGALALRVPAPEAARLLDSRYVVREDSFTGDEAAMCGAAHDFASITPHGVVYPCLSMRVPMGNVRDRAFADIWRTPHEGARIADIRDASWGALRGCATCEARTGCERCPGLALHEDGDVLGPSTTHCALSFARLELQEEVPSLAP
jgi:radical SAM protein with 4Fe4S-binding SPASM domain